jgi:hypothetical protein
MSDAFAGEELVLMSFEVRWTNTVVFEMRKSWGEMH